MKSFNSKTDSSKGKAAQSQTDSFFQAKLNMGQPGDKYELEADQMADQVVEGINDPSAKHATDTAVQTQQEEEVQTKETAEPEVQEKPLAETVTPVVQAQVEEEQVQEKEEEEELQKLEEEELQKSPEASDEGEDENAEGNVQAKSDQNNSVSPQLESQIKSNTGGSSMDAHTQSNMESGFGADFSDVKVHTDSSAVQRSRDLGAQAFTHGNDIYFNEGKYDPESTSGQHLLAHELTHTIQQGSSSAVQSKMVQKDGEEAGALAQDPNEILKIFRLPAVKARHLQVYQAWASQRKLIRKRNFSRDTNANDKPRQVRNWKNHFWDKLQNIENLGLHEDFSGVKKIKIPGDREISGRRRTLLKKLTIPDWNKNGVVQEGKDRYEVDHIVELQVAGWADNQEGNDFPNLELLDGRSNASSGSKTRSNVESTVRDYLEANGESNTQADANTYMASNDLIFEMVEIDSDGGGTSHYWTREEITQGMHLSDLEDLGNIGEPGAPTEFALMTPDDGYLMQLFPHEETVLSIPVSPESTLSKAVAGLSISQINISAGYDSQEKDAQIGTMTVAWDLPENFNAPEGTFQVNIKKSESQYAGMLGNLPDIGLDFTHLSPISFSGFEITDEGIIAEGVLTPSLSFLENATIRVGVRGKEIYFNAEYSPSNINIPIPRLNVNSTTLTVGYSTVDGFGVNGDVELEMPDIAAGNITAGYSEREGLYLRGEINFDEALFGNTQASTRIAYENSLWSVGGTLTIPRNKVTGVKTATINADYSQETGFTATGEAELDIPGIEHGSMTVEYGEEGFSIGGNFDLSSDIPGITGGNVEARVSKEAGAEEYDIFVSGTAQPDIPGISSSLTVTYENGALTIEGSASYSRGMLSGTVNVGATNRAIGDDGEPTGEPDDTMRVYGGGSLTLQLTPWLAATAGVNFTPEGEIEVTARLSSDSYEVFRRREINRNLFSVPTIEIPLFAIPLGPRSIGLVAQIGGGLDFTAGFGPGELRNLSAEITYNPEREEETTVAGHGEFAIPADAGLTLRGDLSLGVSVAIASLSGGIELAGTLGLEGEAAAEVDVNWSPQTGLALDAEGRITVNPKFTFDLNAFARASLGIGWFSISETWRHNLASYEWGPDIQFGVVFPVHYREGEPFDMSFDDIEVIYPDLDVIDMAKGLARDVKNDLFD
ncbi:eCIS core domain-containing protein [Echinicola shivajiensis]|uniref:eCIS core domain-containing protein n=1 Tax=Echinicola shivajiensis TaxID=1035916 RepID=UPI001BFCC0EB|nr:DUF4157 domain-containing protein [Echinicola shivajiensis]